MASNRIRSEETHASAKKTNPVDLLGGPQSVLQVLLQDQENNETIGTERFAYLYNLIYPLLALPNIKCALLVRLGLKLLREPRLEDHEISQDTIAKLSSIQESLSDDNQNEQALRILLALNKSRFDLVSKEDNLDGAILSGSQLSSYLNTNHSTDTAIPDLLGYLFTTRFERSGHIQDIDEAIVNRKLALFRTTPEDPDLPARHNNLGNSALTRFEQLGNNEDLNHAIENYQRAIKLTPEVHPDRSGRESNLGNSFVLRYEYQGNPHDLDRALLHHQNAVNLTPIEHPSAPSLLLNLGTSYLTRFELSGERRDLDVALLYHQQAVDITHERHPNALSQLSDSLLARFQLLGDVQDVEKALEHCRTAVDLTADTDPALPNRLANLARSLSKRYEYGGDVQNLQDAIKYQERAVALAPNGSPETSSKHDNLGCFLLERFKRFANMEDLTQAIDHGQSAADMATNKQLKLAFHSTNLANAYMVRFNLLHSLKDLDRAIKSFNQACELTANGNPEKPLRLSLLGNALLERFQRLGGDVGNLRRAISCNERALEPISDKHTDASLIHNNLGAAHLELFKQREKLENLDSAVFHHQKALDSANEAHPNLASLHQSLGNALFMRFLKLGESKDIEGAVSHHREALSLTPDKHPSKIARYCLLAKTLSYHPQHARSLELVRLCETAARMPHGPPRQRCSAVGWWIRNLRRVYQTSYPPGIMDALEMEMEFLPLLSSIGVDARTRFHELELGSSHIIASDAASVAIENGNPQLALEWLEQGRSVVWNQILQMRTPLDGLKAEYPDRADRLSDLWYMLESPESAQIDEQRHFALSMESDRLIEEVRLLPGFKRFLLPLTYSELQSVARDGPVIVLNSSEFRCDALILTSSNLHSLRLEACTASELADNQALFQNAISGQGLRDVDDERTFRPSQRSGALTRNQIFVRVLGFLWRAVVEPCMKYLASAEILTGADQLKHIIWCPTGPFVFLPIHAAGIYEENGKTSLSLLDYVVSSYTPTLSTMLKIVHEHSSTAISPRQMLAIVQPATPGASRLPGTLKELEIIRKHTTESHMPLITQLGENASIDQVLHSMPECSFVHFACHGIQDIRDPLQSGLLLHDGRLELLKLMETRLPNPRLAFLSACETAVGDRDLPNEAIHLAAGMLSAGFQGVIATMWSIPDVVAPIVADCVYERLFASENVKRNSPAVALHHAIQHLRKKDSNFMSWVPFIFIGT